MAFQTDPRNIGGRVLIFEKMSRHHQRLSKIQSTMNTRKTPFKHVGTKRDMNQSNSQQLDIATSPDFVEVREVIRRLHSIKSGSNKDNIDTDHHRPISFGLINKLSANKKKNHFQQNEHMKNLASLSRRLKTIASEQNRRKNPNDPIAYPSLFFRRVEEQNSPMTSIRRISNKSYSRINDDSYQNVVQNELQKYSSISNSIHNNQTCFTNEGKRIRPQTSTGSPDNQIERKQFKRPLTAASQRPFRKRSVKRQTIDLDWSPKPQKMLCTSNQVKILRKKRHLSGNDPRIARTIENERQQYHNPYFEQYKKEVMQVMFYQRPNQTYQESLEVDLDCPEDEHLDRVKAKIIDYIVRHRLYKDNDIDELFNMARRDNPLMDPDRLEELLSQIQEEFDAQ